MSGLIHPKCRLNFIKSTEIAMDKQNPMIMKQPELGKKILELRKAKGLTQEELVELCNINVRTIQRIESGEVTPRPYTIKAIMEVLGFDFSKIQLENDNSDQSTKPNKKEKSDFLKTAFFFGVVYFFLSFLEFAFDYSIIESGIEAIQAGWYITIKILVIIAFSMFILGYYRLSNWIPNLMTKGASLMLILGILVFNITDILAIYLPQISLIFLGVAKSFFFGSIYLIFGLGLVRYQKAFGSVAFVAGCLSILSGLMFISVFLALPGLFVFTIFEILQLVLLYQAAEGVLDNNKVVFPGSAHVFD